MQRELLNQRQLAKQALLDIQNNAYFLMSQTPEKLLAISHALEKESIAQADPKQKAYILLRSQQARRMITFQEEKKLTPSEIQRRKKLAETILLEIQNNATFLRLQSIDQLQEIQHALVRGSIAQDDQIKKHFLLLCAGQANYMRKFKKEKRQASQTHSSWAWSFFSRVKQLITQTVTAKHDMQQYSSVSLQPPSEQLQDNSLVNNTIIERQY